MSINEGIYLKLSFIISSHVKAKQKQLQQLHFSLISMDFERKTADKAQPYGRGNSLSLPYNIQMELS